MVCQTVVDAAVDLVYCAGVREKDGPRRKREDPTKEPYDAWASAVESFGWIAHFRRGLKPSRHGAFFMGRTPPVSSAPDSVARKKRHHADTPPVVVPACQRGTGVVESTRVESRLSMNESLPLWATGRSLCGVAGSGVGLLPPLGDCRVQCHEVTSYPCHVLYVSVTCVTLRF